MLTLNLLSNDQKRKIRLHKMNLLTKQVIIILLITTASLAGLFMIAKSTLQDSLVKVLETDYQSNYGFNVKINNLNALTQFIKEIKDEHYCWSELLIDLAAKTPANVRLLALNISSDKKSMAIRGLAAKRDDLLALKEGLEKSMLLSNINLPVQSLAEKENISFIINTTLNLENFNH